MPVVKCPSCGRALNLGENAAGAQVQCPACQATCLLPAAQPPLALPVAPPPPAEPGEPIFDPDEPAPAPRPAPPPTSGSAESLFDFAPDAEELAPYTERRRLQTAVAWLSALVAVQAILSLFCCAGGCSVRGGVGVLIAFRLSVVLLYLPLVFVILGAIAMAQAWRRDVGNMGTMTPAPSSAVPVNFQRLVDAAPMRHSTSSGLAMPGTILLGDKRWAAVLPASPRTGCGLGPGSRMVEAVLRCSIGAARQGRS